MAKAIHYKMGADAQEVLEELSKVNAKLTEQNAKLKETGKEGKEAGLGLDQMLNKVGGMVTLAAAVGGVVTMLTAVDDRARLAFDRIEQGIETTKKLLQLSDTVAGFERRAALSNEIALSTGLTEQQAGEILFNVESAGGSQKQAKQLATVFRVEEQPVDVAVAVADLRALSKDFGTVGELINILGVASVKAKATIGQIAGVTIDPLKTAFDEGTFSEPAVFIEDLLATVGGASVGSPNPQRTRTQVQAFLKQLGKQGFFKDQTVGQGIERFLALNGDEKRNLLGGDQEALTGSISIQLRKEAIDDIKTALMEARELTGTPESFLNRRIAIVESSPVLGVTETSRRTRAAETLLDQAGGLHDEMQESVERAVTTVLRAKGKAGGFGDTVFAEIENFFMQGVLEVMDMLGTDPRTMIHFAASVGTLANDRNGDSLDMIFGQLGGREMVDRMMEGIERLDATNLRILQETIKQTIAAENTANGKATNVRLPGPNVPAPTPPQSSGTGIEIR